MPATEDLKHEHRIIERMLAVLDFANVNPPNKIVNHDFYTEVVTFLRDFVDKCHHGKEEDVLFPFMKEKVKDSNSPIAQMLAEHQLGRSYVQEIEQANNKLGSGDTGALATIKNAAQKYSELLYQHIKKEDTILYPMADKVFTRVDNHNLLEKFEEIETERIGAGKHEKFLELIEVLEKKTGITK